MPSDHANQERKIGKRRKEQRNPTKNKKDRKTNDNKWKKIKTEVCYLLNPIYRL